MATHHQLDDDVEGYANLAVQLAMAKEEQREAMLQQHDLDEASYHWRARVVDSAGAISDWEHFGQGNAETDPDFRVVNNPPEMVDLKQHMQNGWVTPSLSVFLVF